MAPRRSSRSTAVGILCVTWLGCVASFLPTVSAQDENRPTGIPKKVASASGDKLIGFLFNNDAGLVRAAGDRIESELMTLQFDPSNLCTVLEKILRGSWPKRAYSARVGAVRKLTLLARVRGVTSARAVLRKGIRRISHLPYSGTGQWCGSCHPYVGRYVTFREAVEAFASLSRTSDEVHEVIDWLSRAIVAYKAAPRLDEVERDLRAEATIEGILRALARRSLTPNPLIDEFIDGFEERRTAGSWYWGDSLEESILELRSLKKVRELWRGDGLQHRVSGSLDQLSSHYYELYSSIPRSELPELTFALRGPLPTAVFDYLRRAHDSDSEGTRAEIEAWLEQQNRLRPATRDANEWLHKLLARVISKPLRPPAGAPDSRP